jgi:hypothetical protein
MMPSCKEVSRLLASGEVDTAPAVRRILTRLHLLMLRDCTRFSRSCDSWADGRQAPAHR